MENTGRIKIDFELFEELNFLEKNIYRKIFHIQIAKTKLKEGESMFRNNEK